MGKLTKIIKSTLLASAITGCITEKIKIPEPYPVPIIVARYEGKIRPNTTIRMGNETYDAVDFKNNHKATYFKSAILYEARNSFVVKLGPNIMSYGCSLQKVLFNKKEYGDFWNLIGEKELKKLRKRYYEKYQGEVY